MVPVRVLFAIEARGETRIIRVRPGAIPDRSIPATASSSMQQLRDDIGPKICKGRADASRGSTGPRPLSSENRVPPSRDDFTDFDHDIFSPKCDGGASASMTTSQDPPEPALAIYVTFDRAPQAKKRAALERVDSLLEKASGYHPKHQSTPESRPLIWSL